MDGTLLDSERVARACFEHALREMGWHVDREAYDRCIGSTGAGTRRILMAAYGDTFPFRELEQRWARGYHARVLNGSVPVKPGIVEVLEYLSALRTPMAVVTSTGRETSQTKLRLAGLDRYFEFLVCGGEAAHGKPHPAPYQLALDRFGLEASVCSAVEDSANGVRAAYAAGCTVFQIPDELEPDEDLKRLGHTILERADQLLEYF